MVEKKEFKKRPEWIPTDEVQDARQRAICQRLDKIIELLDKNIEVQQKRYELEKTLHGPIEE